MKMASLYERVTNGIVADLERGAAPWLRPWKNGASTGIMPQNAATGRPYSGVNILLLWAARDASGWLTPGFMTFQQALAKGGCVRKGEKGTHIIFTKRFTVKEDDDEKQVAMARTYVVFNVAQIDGLQPETTQEPVLTRPDTAADRFVKATGAQIRIGGNMAAYIPSKDFIAMPEMRQFISEASFIATLCHELGHWTAHETRLNRDLKNRFGGKAYAAEELIAELTSAFLCAHLGIEGELRHAGYIATWIVLLKEDNRAIFTAASKASQAATYLRKLSGDATEEE